MSSLHEIISDTVMRITGHIYECSNVIKNDDNTILYNYKIVYNEKRSIITVFITYKDTIYSAMTSFQNLDNSYINCGQSKCYGIVNKAIGITCLSDGGICLRSAFNKNTKENNNIGVYIIGEGPPKLEILMHAINADFIKLFTYS